MAYTDVGYAFGGPELALLLTRTWFPERTGRESRIILDFLKAHGGEYDRYEFSVRVGQGLTPDPTLPANVQRGLSYSSRKRIDMLFRKGDEYTIFEVKERITPHVLGQLLTYSHLLMEDRGLGVPPRLAAVGRYSDDDTRRVLVANGVTLYEYAEAA